MAIYSNLQGTLKSEFTIGKQTLNSGVVISNPSSGVVEFKLGTSGTTNVRIKASDGTNTGTLITQPTVTAIAAALQLDINSRVPQSERGQINGFVPVNSVGKIDANFLPDLSLNQVILVDNKVQRNALTNLDKGDMAVIKSIPEFVPSTIYQTGDIVRVVDSGAMVFYVAKKETTEVVFDPSKVLTTSFAPADVLVTGTRVVYQGKLFVTLVDYTVPGTIVDPSTDPVSFSPVFDPSIPDFKLGVNYAADSFIKNGSLYYKVKAVPYVGMPVTDWASSNLPINGTAITTGQEFIHNNKSYIAIADHVCDGDVLNVTNWRPDSADSGLYICIADPAVPGGKIGPTTDSDWASIGTGTSVDTFAGRFGNVNPQFGDYSTQQVRAVPYKDITSDNNTLQRFVENLADRRLNRFGDTLPGQLDIVGSSATRPALSGSVASPANGLFFFDGGVGFTNNAVERLRVSDKIVVANGTVIDVGTNKITKLGAPAAQDDAARLADVDAKPLVISGTARPSSAQGKPSDAYIQYNTAGTISLPYSSTWATIASDGFNFMVFNRAGRGSVAVSENGLVWEEKTGIHADTGTPGEFINTALSNKRGNFVALRTNSSPTNKPLYTLNNGVSWNVASVFNGTNSYRLANTQPDGTPYVAIPLTESNLLQTSTNGDIWTEIDLGTTGITWGPGAGANNGTIIAGSGVLGSDVVAYKLSTTNTWMTAASLPVVQTWLGACTFDGKNYVVVGKGANNTDSNVAAYSSDGGVTWTQSTMPVSQKWAIAMTNGYSTVAFAENSSIAAISLDNGVTWNQVTIPVGSWDRVKATYSAYVALDRGTVGAENILVSTDDGYTWTETTQAAVINFFVKRTPTEWVEYAQTKPVSYLKTTGGTVTSTVVFNHAANKESINAAGSITTPHLKATALKAFNTGAKTEAGKITIGAETSNSVDNGVSYQGYISSIGNKDGYTISIFSKIKGGSDFKLIEFGRPYLDILTPINVSVVPGVHTSYSGLFKSADTANGVIINNTSVNPLLTMTSTANSAGIRLAKVTDLLTDVGTAPVNGFTADVLGNVFAKSKLTINTDVDPGFSHEYLKIGYTGFNVLRLTGSTLSANVGVSINGPVQANQITTYGLAVIDTGAIRIAAGTTAERPVASPSAPDLGLIRCNKTTGLYEGVVRLPNGDHVWQGLGEGSGKSTVSLGFDATSWKDVSTASAALQTFATEQGHTHFMRIPMSIAIPGIWGPKGYTLLNSVMDIDFVTVVGGIARRVEFDYVLTEEASDGIINVFAQYIGAETKDAGTLSISLSQTTNTVLGTW